MVSPGEAVYLSLASRGETASILLRVRASPFAGPLYPDEVPFPGHHGLRVSWMKEDLWEGLCDDPSLGSAPPLALPTFSATCAY